MLSPRDHHIRLPAAGTAVKQQPPITESLPNKSTLVTYQSANGKPVSFVATIPVPSEGSSTASGSTVANRSHLLESLFERVSVPPAKRLKVESEPDRVAQLTSIAKRDVLHDAFIAAANAIGATSGPLSTTEQMELLKLLKIPTVKWRNLKSFLLSHGVKALAGNEQILRQEMKEIADRYESGTVNGISYYRCTDIVAELEEFVMEKAIAGQLTRRIGVTTDVLRVTVMMDKGGDYTKAFISVWDVEQGLSPTNAVFMGFYRGGDDHDSVYAVFGEALRSLEIAATGINWPYQYGSAAPVTNDESVRAFQNHPAVQQDRKQSQACDPDRKALFDVPYLSNACDRCVELTAAGVRAPSIRTTPYRSIRIAWGGDIMFLQDLLGTNGPNAIYPCHICLIPKEKLQTVGIPSAKAPALRSIATAASHLKERTTGRMGTRNERSFSQINTPMMTLEFTGNIAPSPLHVTLGLVNDLTTELFGEAAKLDRDALKHRRWFADPSLQVPPIRQVIELYRTERTAQRARDKLENQIARNREKLKHLLPQQGMYLEVSDTSATLTQQENKLKSIVQQLTTATNTIANTSGPFTRAVQYRIDQFGVTERPYHGGSYVGKDCERILKHGATISAGIRRAELIDIDGKTTSSGDDALSSKYSALFARLYECFQLYSAARPLCSHEIRLLELRAAALASEWPRTFTPKFHLLTYHMPQFARDWLSIGLSTEQCVESSHPIFNELDRTFAGITQPERKLNSIGQRFLLRSDPSITSYTPPKRICPNCSLPIAKTEFSHCICSF